MRHFLPGQILATLHYDAHLWGTLELSVRCLQGNTVMIWPPAVCDIDPEDPRCRFHKSMITRFLLSADAFCELAGG